jgi:hypothetical protein
VIVGSNRVQVFNIAAREAALRARRQHRQPVILRAPVLLPPLGSDASAPAEPTDAWLIGSVAEVEPTERVEVPTGEQPSGLETISVETLERLGALHVQVVCLSEPDASVTWYLLSSSGEVLQHGNEPTLDDAKLAAIMDAYPPSNEDASPPNRHWDDAE